MSRNTKQDLIVKIENMKRELHRHNNLPRYPDSNEEVCEVCVRNKTLSEVIEKINKEC